MARPFIVRPLAEEDLESAARWYDYERHGLVFPQPRSHHARDGI